MADATYQPTVYKKQGGTELVIASGGTLTLESGGVLALQSGAYMTQPVQVLGVADVATNITNYGITSIVASTTAPTYTLAAPVVGVVKHIYVESNTSSGTAKINSSTTDVSFGSSGANQLQVDATHDAVILAGITTTKWRVTSNVGSVARANKTT